MIVQLPLAATESKLSGAIESLHAHKDSRELQQSALVVHLGSVVVLTVAACAVEAS